MLLSILGSSSKGNGYVLRASNGESLILEAGVPFRKVLRAVGYKRKNIAGVVISHKHKDHFRYAEDYYYEGFYPTTGFVCETLCGACELREKYWHTVWFPSTYLNLNESKKSSFSLFPFSVVHDVPNYGYIIKHPEMGTLLFATDCQHISTAFKGIDHFLIEANYSAEQLLLSDTDSAQKKRIMQSHQSLEDCIDYLHLCHAETAKSITLIHLSSRHSDPEAFKQRIEQEFAVPCTIATKGKIIQL